ncbi:hypothetical protein CLOSTASPAR_03762 [[Clostridium] asparagiforme DSM 15981]|uniref:Uncharacterized protein n=1 Tax=[Clostridium] asparagiforme DSM 15981 TaxID=518636 RepID=C0D3C1_9FIRM|nr:hypothetical protein CLOSTASPAR_03762 [[Clostridium] asparagiforme DSM 15981]
MKLFAAGTPPGSCGDAGGRRFCCFCYGASLKPEAFDAVFRAGEKGRRKMTKPVAETSTFQYNKGNCRGDGGRFTPPCGQRKDGVKENAEKNHHGRYCRHGGSDQEHGVPLF